MPEAAVLYPDPQDPSSVGQIEFDVLVSHETTLASEVTENPVEDGFPVSDHIICRPVRLSIIASVSNTPVTWYERLGNDPARKDDARSALLEIYKSRQPVTVILHDNIYENMVMNDCKIGGDKEDGRILKVPMEFTQVRKVEVKTAEIPEEYAALGVSGKAGTTEAEAGAAKQEEPDATTGTKSKSILRGIFGG